MRTKGRARQYELLAGARPSELRGRARQYELLSRARPSELREGARPCELREELVNVNWGKSSSI